jgi:large repetitive protein
VIGFWASTATGVSWALPMPSWTSVNSFVARAIGGEYGGSDGRAHLVPGSATRASRGASGTRPGSAPGQLPAYSVKTASRTAMRTGPSPLAAHHGFDPKTSTFDARKSTAQQDVFENADGTTSVKDYQRPVNYRKADGTWAKVDAKLVKRASGRFAEASDDAGPSFAASAADPSLLSYSFAPGESVSFGLVGAADVAPAVSGSTAQYVDALPQVSLDL